MLALMNWVWIYVMEGRQEGSQENGDHFADRKKMKWLFRGIEVRNGEHWGFLTVILALKPCSIGTKTTILATWTIPLDFSVIFLLGYFLSILLGSF